MPNVQRHRQKADAILHDLHYRDVPPMTLNDLRTEAWKALPPIRKRLVGRTTVDDLVTIAVHNWEGEYLAACVDNTQRRVYSAALLQAVKRAHQPVSGHDPQEYGFIWMFLLSAIASAVIEWLVKWWLDRRANRDLMAQWKREMAA